MKQRLPTRRTSEAPDGFRLEQDFITTDEEAQLLANVKALHFNSVEMRGIVAKRKTIHYGWTYGYESWQIEPGPSVPEFLLAVRERAARLVGVGPEVLEEALLSHYPPGAGIGWHRDAPMFGPEVIGISLGSSTHMSLRLTQSDHRLLYKTELPRRSAYVLGGAARTDWQHSIVSCADERFSVTFRTLRRRS